MKALVLLSMVVVVAALSAVANAASVSGCAQIVQKINDSAAAIAADTDAYWAHRAKFVDLIFGQSSATVPKAPQAADQEKGQADTTKAGTPSKLASFKGLLTAAQGTGCLSPDLVSAIVEPTIKKAKRVNFDKFLDELPFESSVDQGPPQMPKK